ncbi:hypothetical protein VKT23_013439 [Stygiomarasmius scandens]|uniref:IRG-type G domain-containing protein n=1 Tax=Marasmiellus scandens TaxID=2682957 RepID=A0ABR1J895_9AGAR
MGFLFSRPERNPAMGAIEERLKEQQQAREHAEKQAEEARRDAERIRLEQERQRTEMAEAARRAEEERRKAERKAEESRLERARIEKERAEAERRAQEAEENARLEKEMADREKMEREEAERLRKEADRRAKEAADLAALEREAAEKARIAKEEADAAMKKAREEAGKAKENLANGIQPVSWPTAEQYNRMLKERQYQEGMFHFAVAGLSGSGKSSLVNAFRGIINDTPGSAATGITETTVEVGRYPDSKNPFIWYDIPGAGTLTIKDWDYFNKQGLYIFDAIIVLFDNRFTATDIAILRNCARWKIPSFIVRSKSDRQVEDIKKTMIDKLEADETLDDEELKKQSDKVPKEAVELYTNATRQNVKKNLTEAELGDQRVYLISYQALLGITSVPSRGRRRGLKARMPPLCLDEEDLVTDILRAARERRCPEATKEVAEASIVDVASAVPETSVMSSIFTKLTGGFFGAREH